VVKFAGRICLKIQIIKKEDEKRGRIGKEEAFEKERDEE